MTIEISGLYKRFGSFTAVNNVHLKIEDGELVGLLGPSGSGKTTLLRLIAGLESPDDGHIHFYGKDMQGKSVADRKVGFVFQHYALFRHMTVFDNVAFGLSVMPRKKRPSKEQIENRVMELLDLVKLDWTAERYPSQLSGGQRQRIALARALAVQPKILLLDEPFGALDAKVRKGLRRWLRRLHDDLRMTSVFVTHDQEEALELADRVVVMNDGRIEQIGAPRDVYERPETPFVYKFIGNVTQFRARIVDDRAYLGNIPLDLPKDVRLNGEKTVVYARPHKLEVSCEPGGEGCMKATIEEILFYGPTVKLEVTTEWGDAVEVEIAQERFQTLTLRKHDSIYIKPVENKFFMEIVSPGGKQTIEIPVFPAKAK